MKKLTILILLMVGTLPVMAQSSFHVGYLNTRLQTKDHESYDCRAHGAMMGWTYRLKARPDIPLYITIGADLNWNWIKDTEDYLHGSNLEIIEQLEREDIMYRPMDVRRINYGGIKIPFNFAYEIQLSKKRPLYLIPQIGLHANINFVAHEKEIFTSYYKDLTTDEEYMEEDRASYNLIGNTDLGVYSYHRVVVGWQLGLSLRSGHYIVGTTFEQELLHLTNYGHTTAFTIKLGYEL